MQKSIVFILLIITGFSLFDCHHKDSTPAPVVSKPDTTIHVVSSVHQNNSFTLSNGPSTTYKTTIVAEETVIRNGHFIYAIIIEDSSRSYSEQFWFKSKPTAGTYSVEDILASYTNGVSTGGVAIAVTDGTTDFFSQGDGTITITQNGSNLTINVNDIILADADSKAQRLDSEVTLP